MLNKLFPKRPNKYQWAQFFRVLSKKEKIIFSIFFIVFLTSFILLFTNLYFQKTKVAPARGGTYIEGVIGQPRYINPVYANSDADRDLIQLVFSGLMKYNENLEIVPDLVQSYEISPDKKTYTFYLKENLTWQDKESLTVEDVIYTIKLIQDSAYNSPLKKNWVGVKVEKLGELTVQFTLQQPYASFLENCTVKILPKHIWQNVDPKNFGLEIYNLKPIGSGPYKVKEIKQNKPGNISSLTLVQNSQYFGKKPNISEIEFLFFKNQEDLVKAAKKGEIKGLYLNSFKELGNYNYYHLSFPRYFAVFFNQNKSDLLSKKDIRQALKYGTNKRELTKEALEIEDVGMIKKAITDSPILPQIYQFPEPTVTYKFDPEKSKEILENLGFRDENGDGSREKTVQKESAFTFTQNLENEDQGTEVEKLQQCLAKFQDVYPEGEITGYFGPKTKQAVINFQEKYKADILDPWGFTKGTGLVRKTTIAKLNEVCFERGEEITPLKFALTTVEQPQMEKVANLLKTQWEKLGFKIEIKTFAASELEQEVIKPREYQALLFGEVLGAIPDPFPFWHSSQKKDPGLNLALYENEEVDKLLEENRKASDPKIRKEKLASFQNIILQDIPAIFLYSPPYLYAISDEIKGTDIKKITEPSKRFIEIENWYIKTKRKWR